MRLRERYCEHCGKRTIGASRLCIDCALYGQRGPSLWEKHEYAKQKAYDERLGERLDWQEKLRWMEIGDIARRSERRQAFDDHIYRPSDYRSTDFRSSDFVSDWKQAERTKKLIEDIDFQNRMRDILKKSKWDLNTNW